VAAKVARVDRDAEVLALRAVAIGVDFVAASALAPAAGDALRLTAPALPVGFTAVAVAVLLAIAQAEPADAVVDPGRIDDAVLGVDQPGVLDRDRPAPGDPLDIAVLTDRAVGRSS
jgi:hypothetical protein